MLFFAVTSYCLVERLSAPDCITPECPSGIKTWLVGAFASFYLLQVACVAMFRAKNRRLAKWLLFVTSVAVVPSVLAWNVWGNTLQMAMD